MRQQIAALAAALALAQPAAAADAFALFDRFIAAPATTLEFRQTAFDSAGAELETVTGFLAYQRPDKFRLQYHTPENPLIVSDGVTVWVYEEQLQQVVTHPFAKASRHGLLEVLTSGSLKTLEKKYLFSSGVGGELKWLVAQALDSGAALPRIALGFEDGSGALRQVVINDQFDSTIRMDIESATPAVSAPDELFSFTAPPGSEVLVSP